MKITISFIHPNTYKYINKRNFTDFSLPLDMPIQNLLGSDTNKNGITPIPVDIAVIHP